MRFDCGIILWYQNPHLKCAYFFNTLLKKFPINENQQSISTTNGLSDLHTSWLELLPANQGRGYMAHNS